VAAENRNRGVTVVGELLTHLWQNIIGRGSGPMSLRLLLQPMAAAFFAIRSGLRDAREGRTPYGWTVISAKESRGGLLREGWKDVGKVFVVATILDGVYQFIVFHRVYVLGAAIIAATLALIPYMLIRGLANRIARARYRSAKPNHGEI
jgi:hypothetical protein